MVLQIYIFASSAQGLPFFHILINVCYLLSICDSLTVVRWYLIVVLICIFLMIHEETWFLSLWGLGRSPGEEGGNPLQCSCLENPMDKGTWQDTVHEVTKESTRLSNSIITKVQGTGGGFCARWRRRATLRTCHLSQMRSKSSRPLGDVHSEPGEEKQGRQV